MSGSPNFSPFEPIVRDQGLSRRYLRACLLLLVSESPTHGYELRARLGEFGLPRPEAGSLYRTLRTLENEGLLESWWASVSTGPARRLYRPTAAGTRCLSEITDTLATSHQHLSAYLQRHRTLASPEHEVHNSSDQPVLAFAGQRGDDG